MSSLTLSTPLPMRVTTSSMGRIQSPPPPTSSSSSSSASPDDDVQLGGGGGMFSPLSKRSVTLQAPWSVLVRDACTEALCVFFLVFFVQVTVFTTGNPTHGPPTPISTSSSSSSSSVLDLGKLGAFAGVNGLAVAAIILSFAHTSGAYLNPAMIIAQVCTGHFRDLRRALVLIVAELTGSALASSIGLAYPNAAQEFYAATLPATGISDGLALLSEFVFTFLLAVVAFHVTLDPRANGFGLDDSRRSPHVQAALAIGSTVACCVFCGAYISGASMNPARSFGPALIGWVWRSHWVYWVGPCLGAIAGGALHRWFLASFPPLSTPSTQLSTRVSSLLISKSPSSYTPPPPASYRPLISNDPSTSEYTQFDSSSTL